MLLIVETLTGKLIYLDDDWHETETVEELKDSIWDQEEIEHERQILNFNDTQLEDGKPLAHYNIQSDSLVHLALRVRGGIQMYVETHTGNTIPLDVDTSDTVEKVKTMIWDAEGIPPNQQRLVFGKTPMSEHFRTLAEYGIDKGSIVHLLLHPRRVFPVSVKNHYRLIFRDMRLEDDRTLADRKIQEGATVLLVLCLGVIHIFVETLKGKISLEVESWKTLEYVKSIIPFVERDLPHYQVLGKQVDETLRLVDYDIRNNDTLRLVRVPTF